MKKAKLSNNQTLVTKVREEDEVEVNQLDIVEVSQKVNYQIYYQYSKNELQEKIGICQLCKKKGINKLIKMKNSNTTGLKCHLQSCHKTLFTQIFGNNTKSKKEKNQNTIESFLKTSEVSLIKYIYLLVL